MTVQHIIDYYQDGFTAIPFCKNCSAEGNNLSFVCIPLMTSQEIALAEFDKKYQKALDQSKPTVK